MKPRHTVPRNPVCDKPKPETLANRWDRWTHRPAWHKPDADLTAAIDEAYRAKVEAARAAASVETEA